MQPSSIKETIVAEKPVKDSSTNWIQRLKDESWEAEILVSTVAIFGTSQLFKVINWLTNIFIDILQPSQYLVGYFIVYFGLVAVSILVSMFIIHFILRAYWVGLVGLNSVFPDYSNENSAYSKIYTEKLISILPKLKDSILKVDELTSVIFSVAFAFLFMFIYVATLTSIYLLVFNLLSDYIPYYLLLLPAAIIIFFMSLQVIFGVIANTKKNKENEVMQIRFFKSSYFTYLLVLGPLYKSIVQIIMIFSSNFKKKKSLIFLLISFLVLGMSTTFFQFTNTNIIYLIIKGVNIPLDKTQIYKGYYQTENDDVDFLLTPEISSDIIQESILKVFIPIYKYEKNLAKETCDTYVENMDLTRNEQRVEKWNSVLNCYQKYNLVYLNDDKVPVDFLKYNHPKTNQFGVVAYINLTGNMRGKNTLKIKKHYKNDNNNTEWEIPFQYIPK